MKSNKLEIFSKMSQTIGENVDYVQGGGGNTSVKLDDKKMVIKASGFLLKNVSMQEGYSVVDYQNIKKYIQTPDKTNDDFSSRINSFVLDTNNRPSIETGFHALLGASVIHTHSIYANILTCSKEGKELTKSLFPSSMWVEYTTPGLDLTVSIRDKLNQRKTTPKIIFLQNHGLIISSDTSDFSFNLHEEVNKKIQEYFNFSGIVEHRYEKTNILFIKKNILFPDQIVYTLASDELLQTTAAQETLEAYQHILHYIKKTKLTPNFLNSREVDTILNMESEKFRQQQVIK